MYTLLISSTATLPVQAQAACFRKHETSAGVFLFERECRNPFFFRALSTIQTSRVENLNRVILSTSEWDSICAYSILTVTTTNRSNATSANLRTVSCGYCLNFKWTSWQFVQISILTAAMAAGVLAVLVCALFGRTIRWY